MSSACKVYVEQVDVERRLASLGLQLPPIQEVVNYILLMNNSFTEDHPSWGPGITLASEAVAYLRGALKPHGWRKEEEKSFALTVHPNGSIAINVAKGDEDVGVEEGKPVTSSDKGICTELAIAKNQISFSFPHALKPQDEKRRPTWYLLYNASNGKIMAELSLPVGLSASKHIDKWSERILIPLAPSRTPTGSTGPLEKIEFEVKMSRKK